MRRKKEISTFELPGVEMLDSTTEHTKNTGTKI